MHICVSENHFSCSCTAAVGEMRQEKNQGALSEAMAAQLLPKLGAVRGCALAAFGSLNPELYEMTSPMGSRSPEALQSKRNTACGMLVSTMKVRRA